LSERGTRHYRDRGVVILEHDSNRAVIAEACHFRGLAVEPDAASESRGCCYCAMLPMIHLGSFAFIPLSGL
jgi:hypothetical protein